jgi:hypothetical protein
MYLINHNLELGMYQLTDIITGLENSVALNKIYGNRLKEVLNTTEANVVSKPWQIWVTLYLDFIHEMVHIWQISDGKNVFDRSVSYVDAPTEIEAYRYTIEDAERIGFSKTDIIDYLKVRWISKEEHLRLVKAVLG